MDLRAFAVTIILLPALYACSHSNEKWENNPENDKIVHVSGTIAHLSPRDVRIALVGTDIIHGGDYYSIKVKGGRFTADVPLNQDMVYELLIPVRNGYSEMRVQTFFADQDSILFAYDRQENPFRAPALILNPAGDNEAYLAFRAERAERFAEENRSLEDEYTSIKDHYYTDEFGRLCDELNDRSLDQSARDTIRLLIGQMNADLSAYTPEGRSYLARRNELKKKELDFARDYLEARPSSLDLFEIMYESVG